MGKEIGRETSAIIFQKQEFGYDNVRSYIPSHLIFYFHRYRSFSLEKTFFAKNGQRLGRVDRGAADTWFYRYRSYHQVDFDFWIYSLFRCSIARMQFWHSCGFSVAEFHH